MPPLGSFSFTFVPVVPVSRSEVQQAAISSWGISCLVDPDRSCGQCVKMKDRKRERKRALKYTLRPTRRVYRVSRVFDLSFLRCSVARRFLGDRRCRPRAPCRSVSSWGFSCFFGSFSFAWVNVRQDEKQRERKSREIHIWTPTVRVYRLSRVCVCSMFCFIVDG